jgi:formylglycine-generating enzyme required for sulfatase activity
MFFCVSQNITFKKMKRLSLFACVLLGLTACKNSGDGQLVGVSNKTKFPTFTPYGMVYIPEGNFTLGLGENDPTVAFATQPRTVTVTKFWMDETEITNNEYKQFVNWVRDSIAHTILGEAEITDAEKYGHYLKYKKGERAGEIMEPKQINWKEEIPWNSTNEEVQDALGYLYAKSSIYFNFRRLNVSKLNYEYWVFDYEAAAKKEKEGSSIGGMFASRKSHVDGDIDRFIKKYATNVYPDTLVWIYEFTYSDNEHMTQNYFSHPQYGHYPVVGVNWVQCQAFCHWRTQQRNAWLLSRGYPVESDFKLPTEAEWEWAARGGLQGNNYPWGSYYPSNQNGCFLANFKPQRGNFTADGSLYPAVVAFYPANDYGLYDMSGNVSEWCSDAYNTSSSSFVSDINPIYKYNADPNEPAESSVPIWYTQSATAYARAHWYPMANQNHFALFISRLIAPIAAKHGAHSKLKTRNE